ncbi:hypothetical protein [Bifidobacterium tibiigranuli]|jgi:hypothetical protein|uniref:hypothetical protein n=1 Tax=Bifidobacterium tibiigranuli TaxID=2172043 RepID=UPI0026EB90E4|nr:hypothetical protein [Bifidobacterium tibiigranuli]MCI1650588.1 hypothetical protein [Bifidobacterium tibiigranuli]MCI2186097.1 hypothetical protein [Bifidobacterium tibiigranuli]MCI2204142.1 hypothetical protein [Bifidobacterium tibiigranuli]
MTVVSNGPSLYEQAESIASRRGVNIDDLVNAFLAGYVAGGSPQRDERGYPILRLNPNYSGIVRPEIRDGAVVLPEGCPA